MKRIESHGPDGAPNNIVSIRAWRGIVQTECRDVNTLGTVFPRDMFANVRADLQPDDAAELTKFETHGRLKKFYVSGDYQGEIRAWCVRPDGYPNGDPNLTTASSSRA